MTLRNYMFPNGLSPFLQLYLFLQKSWFYKPFPDTAFWYMYSASALLSSPAVYLIVSLFLCCGENCLTYSLSHPVLLPHSTLCSCLRWHFHIQNNVWHQKCLLTIIIIRNSNNLSLIMLYNLQSVFICIILFVSSPYTEGTKVKKGWRTYTRLELLYENF